MNLTDDQIREFICIGTRFLRMESAAGRLYAVMIPGFLAESRDAGNIWNPVEKQPPADFLSDLTVSAAGDRICVTTDTDVWSTSDGCHSWSRIPLPVELAAPGEPALCAIQLLDDGSLFLIGPQAGSAPVQLHVYAMTAPAAAWEKIGAHIMNPAFASMFHRPLSVQPDQSVIVGCYPGVYRLRKTPNGYGPIEHLFPKTKNNPAPISDGFDVAVIEALAVSASDPSVMAVAASIDLHTHIHISLDGGATWTARDPLPLGFLVDDMIFEGTTLYAKVGGSMIPGKGFQQFIMATADKGVTWRDLTTPEVAATLSREAGMFPFIGVARRSGLSAVDGQLLIYSPAIPLQSIAI
jgi:photosystem II stability/assembly factor-like uncharacterized protein